MYALSRFQHNESYSVGRPHQLEPGSVEILLVRRDLFLNLAFCGEFDKNQGKSFYNMRRFELNVGNFNAKVAL